MPFDQNFILSNFKDFLPEIIIITTLIIVLLIELIEENSIWLFRVTIGALLIASSVLLFQWFYPNSNTFLSNYHINGLTITFRCLLTLSVTFSVLISQEYVQRAGIPIAEFLIFLLTATVGGLFLCGANDLITLFVALECLSLSSYLLAGCSKLDIRSNEAAMKYLLMGGASSAILAYGFSWLYGLSGGKLEFYDILLALTHYTASPLPVGLALVSTLVGISFKLSIVPFHQWAPDVYEGSPTPVVAFFSVGSKVASFALIIRVLTLVFPFIQVTWEPIVSTLAIATMILGNLIALTQTSIKRLLAYSSISQAGYLMIGILYGQSLGYTPMILYMLTYIFMNIGAFACIIQISLKTGTDQIRDYAGFYFRDPVLTTCLTICLLSLAGIPPFAGFFVKLYIFWCGWKVGLYPVVYVGLITSVISIYYYLRIIKMMITKEKQEISSYIKDYTILPFSWIPRNALEISIALCVLLSTTLGFVLNPLISLTNYTLSVV